MLTLQELDCADALQRMLCPLLPLCSGMNAQTTSDKATTKPRLNLALDTQGIVGIPIAIVPLRTHILNLHVGSLTALARLVFGSRNDVMRVCARHGSL